MKYSINFYLEELKPTVYYLTLKNTGYAVLGVVVLVLGWSMLLDSQIKDNKSHIRTTKQQLSAANTKLSNLQSDLVQHNDKATFNQRKQRLQQNLDAKLMLWEGVGKKLEATTVNYHTVLDQLTKLHNDNIWLSSFEFNENIIIFRGFALESSAVTRWMTQLQSSDSFKGREFSYLKMKVHDEATLAFVVATEEQKEEASLEFGPSGVIPPGLIPPGAIPSGVIPEGTLPPGVVGGE